MERSAIMAIPAPGPNGASNPCRKTICTRLNRPMTPGRKRIRRHSIKPPAHRRQIHDRVRPPPATDRRRPGGVVADSVHRRAAVGATAHDDIGKAGARTDADPAAASEHPVAARDADASIRARAIGSFASHPTHRPAHDDRSRSLYANAAATTGPGPKPVRLRPGKLVRPDAGAARTLHTAGRR